MFNPFFRQILNLRAGSLGELGISRLFVLYQKDINGINQRTNEYGMLTIPG